MLAGRALPLVLLLTLAGPASAWEGPEGGARGASPPPLAAASARVDTGGGRLGSGAESDQALLDRHARKVQDWERTAEAVVGPLPAVASTPYFGLAALSLAGLVAGTDAVRESRDPWVIAFRDNALVRESRRYATWPILLTLLGLALITYLANSGKLRGTAGKLLRVIEDGSSAILYFALSLGALHAALPAAGGAGGAAVARMGVLEVSGEALLAFGLAVGLAAMMLARYGLDLLIWLIPVPFIDFAFETLKKVLTLGFLALYLFAPVVAAVLSLVLLVVALFVSGWALRMVRRAYHLLVRPRLTPAASEGS